MLGCSLLVSDAFLATTARADVTVINETNDTLYVGHGQHVNGKIVYGGWTTIQNGASAKVYAGNENKIILCAFNFANGQRIYRVPGNQPQLAQYEASSDGFKMEQIGGAAQEWKFTDLTRNVVYFKDVNNGWPNNLNLFKANFYVVNGSTDQRFIP